MLKFRGYKKYAAAGYLAQTEVSDIGCTVYMGGAIAADDNWRHARSCINSAPQALRMRLSRYMQTWIGRVDSYAARIEHCLFASNKSGEKAQHLPFIVSSVTVTKRKQITSSSARS